MNIFSSFFPKPSPSSWAEIDLSAIEFNYNQVKKIVFSQTKVLAALKADAYGHGAIEVARKLTAVGVDYFGVATLSEALELRKNRIHKPILLLTNFINSDYNFLIRYGITPTIADFSSAQILNDNLKKLGRKISIHLKIDTGMGRIGVWYREAVDFITKVSNLKNLVIEGIYTHFPSADEDQAFTHSQLILFQELVKELEKKNIHIPFKHCANSAAILYHKYSYLNLVRPGLVLYGLYPLPDSHKPIELKPALSFKTRISYLKKVSKGRSISYGRTFNADKEILVATISAGYADGYNRLLSNKSSVLIQGKRCPVIGRICMDQTMVDVTGLNVSVGDEVILIGSDGQEQVNAEELAGLCSTISYEIVCGISKRVERFYIKES